MVTIRSALTLMMFTFNLSFTNVAVLSNANIQMYACGGQLEVSPVGIFMIISGMYYIILGGYAPLAAWLRAHVYELLTRTHIYIYSESHSKPNIFCLVLHASQFNFRRPMQLLLQQPVLIHGPRFPTFLSLYWLLSLFWFYLLNWKMAPVAFSRYLDVFEPIIHY